MRLCTRCWQCGNVERQTDRKANSVSEVVAKMKICEKGIVMCVTTVAEVSKPKRFGRVLGKLVIAIFVTAVFSNLSACGSSNDDAGTESVFDESIIAETPSLQINTVPSAINGYFLSRETTEFADGSVIRDHSFVLNSDERTMSRTDFGQSTEAGTEVVHFFNEAGLIISRENRDESGVAYQTFNSEYDSNRRLIASKSFNGADPFLTGIFEYSGNILTRKEFNSSVNGSSFSETTYTYSTEGVLEASALTSPLIRKRLVNNYVFDSESRLSTVLEMDSTTSIVESTVTIEYDENNNVVSMSEFDESGELSILTTFEYTAAEGNIPNLNLHDIIYNFDQI